LVKQRLEVRHIHRLFIPGLVFGAFVSEPSEEASFGEQFVDVFDDAPVLEEIVVLVIAEEGEPGFDDQPVAGEAAVGAEAGDLCDVAMDGPMAYNSAAILLLIFTSIHCCTIVAGNHSGNDAPIGIDAFHFASQVKLLIRDSAYYSHIGHMK